MRSLVERARGTHRGQSVRAPAPLPRPSSAPVLPPRRAPPPLPAAPGPPPPCNWGGGRRRSDAARRHRRLWACTAGARGSPGSPFGSAGSFARSTRASNTCEYATQPPRPWASPPPPTLALRLSPRTPPQALDVGAPRPSSQTLTLLPRPCPLDPFPRPGASRPSSQRAPGPSAKPFPMR